MSEFSATNDHASNISQVLGNESNEKSVPLSLEHLHEAISQRHPKTRINQNNVREICAHVDFLDFQFKDIGSLELAWLLSNITHLYISNNKLRNVKGLEHLTKLRLLDLSFNKVNNIDHLGRLENLEVLSLHGNCISTLNENVFLALTKLKVITLGSNLISDNKQVLIFGRKETLESLTLKNNPCSQEEYPLYVIAHLPNLVYLDYRRITEDERRKAFDIYSESLMVVKQENEIRREEMKSSRAKKEEEERHRTAGVYALNDDSLFNKLFEGDNEMQALTLQHGVQSLIDRFQEQFKRVCLRLFEEGLLHAKQRDKELMLLGEAISEAKQMTNDVSRQKVTNQEKIIKSLLDEAKEIMGDEYENTSLDQEDYEERERKISELKEKIESALDETMTELLENEVILVNQIKEVLEKAEEELGSMVTAFLSEAAEHFDEGRRHAYTFYCRLRELTTKIVDSATTTSKNNASDKDGPPATSLNDVATPPTENKADRNYTAEIFEGGDTLTAALARIHDTHLDVINKREEEFKTHLSTWLCKRLEEFHRLEWRRHRTRLEEITILSREKARQISEVLPLDIFEAV